LEEAKILDGAMGGRAITRVEECACDHPLGESGGMWRDAGCVGDIAQGSDEGWLWEVRFELFEGEEHGDGKGRMWSVEDVLNACVEDIGLEGRVCRCGQGEE